MPVITICGLTYMGEGIYISQPKVKKKNMKKGKITSFRAFIVRFVRLFRFRFHSEDSRLNQYVKLCL